jgi:hypothetical protein
MVQRREEGGVTLSPDRVRELLGTPKPVVKHRRIDNLGRYVALKLWPEQREEIRRRRDTGESGLKLAREFGVSQAYVSMVWNGKR